MIITCHNRHIMQVYQDQAWVQMQIHLYLKKCCICFSRSHHLVDNARILIKFDSHLNPSLINPKAVIMGNIVYYDLYIKQTGSHCHKYCHSQLYNTSKVKHNFVNSLSSHFLNHKTLCINDLWDTMSRTHADKMQPAACHSLCHLIGTVSLFKHTVNDHIPSCVGVVSKQFMSTPLQNHVTVS